MACVLLTGFSSGLPYALTGATLQAWLTKAGVNLSLIGVFAMVTLPYTLKFLWSPLMDRFVPPFLGRRRGWILISQAALVGGIAVMAVTGVSDPWVIGVVALTVAFFSASQDIAVDAYRAEILRPDELGAGAGLYILGYRAGLITSGALAMILADHLSWNVVYLMMAGVMGLGIVTTILAPEPAVGVKAPPTLGQAVVLPFLEFLRRRGALEMLLFILIYKFDWAMVQAMMTPFMIRTGFTMTEIGAVTQGVGMAATIVGAMVGGAVITAIGIRRSLWAFGLLQGLAGILFTALALLGKDYAVMVGAIVVENVCSGMATAAFAGFIMSLCNQRFTATQFALLTSLMAMGRMVAGVAAGWFADRVGWPTYFAVATVIMAPGLLLLLRFRAWQDGATAATRTRASPPADAASANKLRDAGGRVC